MTAPDGFVVTGQHFVGTLAELVERIQSDTISILDISLAEITASFLAYMQQHTPVSILHTVDVYFYSAQLLLIKSRVLTSTEERTDPAELKEEMIEILVEFQRLKKLSDELQKRQITDTRYIARGAKIKDILRHYRQVDLVRMPLAIRDVSELPAYLESLAAKRRIIAALPRISRFPLSIMRTRLLGAIERGAITLLDLIVQNDNCAELVSALFVVLLATQRRMVRAAQPQPFAAVTIVKRAALSASATGLR